MSQAATRNFCIIAHIDHGKSTLADRMLELTKTVEQREMQDQLLDQMDLERERGITIKLQPVRMGWKGHTLNLIDTPGHVDFSYEVSRSLAAVEAAVLLVDASQGVQAQTLAVLYQALDQGLEIIPVINKIDLPHAEPERRREELVSLIGCKPEDVVFCSGKSGVGVDQLLDAIVARTPAPSGNPEAELRGLVFDAVFDPYRGVVAYVRIVDGTLKKGDGVTLIQGKRTTEALEVGRFAPRRTAEPELPTGTIGYIVTGLKGVADIGIGDTITLTRKPSTKALEGYRKVTPMVFASLFPTDADDYQVLRDAIDKYALNDSALTYVAEHSPALGFGFRCGFLGMLHLEIVTERLQREFGAETISTVPSVAYELSVTSGEELEVTSPSELPDVTRIKELREPWVKLEVVTPQAHMGAVMELSNRHRGSFVNTAFLDLDRAVCTFELPLSEIVVHYYDELKSVTSGYASMSYELLGFRAGNLVKMDMVVAGEPVEPLATIVPRNLADSRGRAMCERLKELIPRQNFEVRIQACISGKIIASESISAMRKDVTAKLYGGDVTRKNKLLEKQKKGKARMKQFGRVAIPSEVFVEVLKR